jgi:hypothetical protein
MIIFEKNTLDWVNDFKGSANETMYEIRKTKLS